MKPADVKEIYIEACRFKRRSPDAGVCKEWEKAFQFSDAVDLREAMSLHWADREQGQWFPEPGKLKPLVEQANRMRLARASAELVLVRWECPDCKKAYSGHIDPHDFKPRRCRGVGPDGKPGTICAAKMNEVHREAAVREEVHA